MPLASFHALAGGRLTRACRIIARVALLVCCTPLLAREPAHGSRGGLALYSSSSAYDQALRMREALEGRPRQQRTRRDYNRVLEAFRAVYHGTPRGANADASADAVAELLAEQGRMFEVPRASQDAIGQYEFLRREYPASRYRYSALLTEGEIYSRDLDDRVAARTIFNLFLKLYPQNALAEEARQELKKMRADERTPVRRRQLPGVAPGAARASPQTSSHHDAVLTAALASQAADGQTRSKPRSSASPALGSALSSNLHSEGTQAGLNPPVPRASSVRGGTLVERDLPSEPGGNTTVSATRVLRRGKEPPPNTTLSEAALNAPPPLPRRGRLPLVTGVRHWSTSDYTRVAIDLDSEVQYEASRVPNPDRIFFDLHGARLSPELVGKAVTVTDGGYLKRVRAAQFSNDMVRVVLDVSDVSEYSAFFLPNPARLIIDIHGKAQGHGAAVESASAVQTGPARGMAGAKSSSAVAAPGPTSVPIRRTVVSASDAATVAHQRSGGSGSGVAVAHASKPTADTLGDIATLDRQPDTVRATRSPTTAPVAASVADITPAPQPGTVLVPAPDLTTHHPRTSQAEAKAARAHDITPADTPAPAIHAANVPPSLPTTRTPFGPQGRTAAPTATGERSMVRALGLKIGRIVVDAGHGGHDSGTLGPGGIEEKDVVLDVALRLGRLLKQRLGADVIFTRDDDTFIPLETRTAIANKAQADLFISVHANSSQDASARGVETYYLNFTSSADALEVAARENAVSDQSIHQLSDLVKKITLQDKISESREFAGDVEQSLYSGLEAGNSGFKDRGVKKAPFVVLIGANMPSILAEISFLTNPDDAHQLRDPEYRQRIAESLYRGVAKYIGSLSGVRLAEGSPRPTGQ
jgi:N-acetylmuramoyl-L-alanine amidase